MLQDRCYLNRWCSIYTIWIQKHRYTSRSWLKIMIPPISPDLRWIIGKENWFHLYLQISAESGCVFTTKLKNISTIPSKLSKIYHLQITAISLQITAFSLQITAEFLNVFGKKTKKKNQWILCFLSIFNSRKDNRSSGEKYCRDLPAQPPDPSIHIPSWGWEGAYHSFWSEFAGQTCRGRGIWWIYIYMILEYWYVLVISSRWKELHMEA